MDPLEPHDPNDHDTALARRLVERGTFGRDEVLARLHKLRRDRAREPELSLALLLAREGISADALASAAADLPSATPAPSPRPQHLAPGYSVVRELAQGGMGAVYEVVHDATGARRALKTLLPVGFDLEQAELERLRLREESLAQAALDHPAIVRLHAADMEARPPYLIQDLMPNGSLAERLTRAGPLPIGAAVEVLARVAEGLAHAHAQGVLHRDLKPANVLFDDQHQARLTDFGLALRLDASLRLTLTGQVVGTPAFMPPEQALGTEVDERTDVYGLGAILYAALTGQPPFAGNNPVRVLTQVLGERPTPPRHLRPDLPLAVEAVCLKALARDPQDRYPDAISFRAALLGSLTATPRARAWPLIALTAAALLLIPLALAVWNRDPGDSDPAAPVPSSPTPAPVASSLPLLTGPQLIAELRGSFSWVTLEQRRRSKVWFEVVLRVTEVAPRKIVFKGEVDNLNLDLKLGDGALIKFNSQAQPDPANAILEERARTFVGATFALHVDPQARTVAVSGLPRLDNLPQLNDVFGGFLTLLASSGRKAKGGAEQSWTIENRILTPFVGATVETTQRCKLVRPARGARSLQLSSTFTPTGAWKQLGDVAFRKPNLAVAEMEIKSEGGIPVQAGMKISASREHLEPTTKRWVRLHTSTWSSFQLKLKTRR